MLQPPNNVFLNVKRTIKNTFTVILILSNICFEDKCSIPEMDNGSYSRPSVSFHMNSILTKNSRTDEQLSVTRESRKFY